MAGDEGKTSLETTLTGSTTGALGFIESIRVGGGAVEVGDVSTLADIWKRKIPGQADAGTITVNCQYDSTDLAAVFTAVRVVQTFTVTDADGDNCIWSGFVSSTPEINYDKSPITINFNIELSGEPDFNIAT